MAGKSLLSGENNEKLNAQRSKLNESILKLMKKQRKSIDNPVHFRNERRWNQVVLI